MNIVSTNVFGEEEEERDLTLADGRSFHASGFSAFSNDGSELVCVCEFAQPGYMCLPCSVKFLDVDPRLEERAKTCQNWLNSLSYEYTGCAMNGEDTYNWDGEKWLNSLLHEYVGRPENGGSIFNWKGEIAFECAGTLYLQEHHVSFMGLAATPDAVAPGEDMSLPVGSWTGKSEIIMGRYMQGGHLMIDASRIEWIRIFPLTGHYMICAKTVNKVQRFVVPGEVYKENHPGWEEFCDQKEGLSIPRLALYSAPAPLSIR